MECGFDFQVDQKRLKLGNANEITGCGLQQCHTASLDELEHFGLGQFPELHFGIHLVFDNSLSCAIATSNDKGVSTVTFLKQLKQLTLTLESGEPTINDIGGMWQ